MNVIGSTLHKAHYHKLEEERLGIVLKAMRKNSMINFLDVGCGKGYNLRLAKELGFTVCGVDINEQYVTAGKSMGYNCLTLGEFNTVEEKFDVILMSHVIEHVEFVSLRGMLESYLDRLSPMGKLIILSPLLSNRFYYDFTHIRPYYPQSIWHAFGENREEISIDRVGWSLKLEDIYFFNDSFRTRERRSYYINDGLGIKFWTLKLVNFTLAILFLLSRGLLGTRASWMAVYSKETR